MMRTTEHPPVILFDGVCNLCTGAVQFVIKRDPRRIFRFASLQSNIARELLKGEQTGGTFVLIENGKIYKRSDGALRIAKRLKGAWPLLYGFIIIPRFIRDAVYDMVSKNRYKWFGQKESCWLPSDEWRDLFL